MVFRIQGTNGISQNAFSGSDGQIEAAGQQAAQPFFKAANDIDQGLQKEAKLLSRVELSRIEREMASDLSEISSASPEGGAGYTEAAMEAWGRRKDQAYERSRGNPYIRERLDSAFKVADEENRGVFEGHERKFRLQYSINQHEATVDDWMQQIGRTDYGLPNNYSGFKSRMGISESGGNASATRQNTDGRHFSGKYQFGQARLDDFTRANGLGRITLEQFRKDPQLQENAMDWHINDIDQYIASNGLEGFFGQTVGGVVMTRDGMRAMAHLGGRGGMKDFLESGGKKNPSDQLGTSLSDYAQKFGVDQYGVPNHNGATPNLSNDPIIQAALSETFSQIDGLSISGNEKAELKRQARAQIYGSALQNLSQQNGSAALAVLRSGALDEFLDHSVTSKYEEGLSRDILKTLEQQFVADAKRQQRENKDAANLKADNLIAYRDASFEGEAPPDLTQDEYMSLPIETRQKVDQMPFIQRAVDIAKNADIADLGVARQGLQPEGESFARDQAALDAFDDIANERRLQAGRSMNLAEREVAIAAADGDLRDDLIAQQKTHLSGLKNNQVDLMRQAGQEVPALSGDNLIASLSDRLDRVSPFANDNNAEPVLLTPSERAQITEQFREMQMPEKMEFMQQVSGDPQMAELLFSEISDASPFLSHSGGMMVNGGDVQAVSLAMQGYDASIKGQKFTNISQNDKVLTFSADLKEAMRGMPDVFTDVDSFASNYARGKAIENAGEVSADDYSEGLAAAIGETFKYNKPGILNGKTKAMILPPNVSSSQMSDFLTGLDDEAIASINGGQLPKDAEGVDVDAGYIKRNADYLTIGIGTYMVEIDGEPILAQDGSAFTIQFGQ